ncbi:hypothetical protein GUF49_04745, partial [Xanthomonas citri pv. citri]|nr:hypothetical protein [Xanthomonas citri pv. citri]
GGGEAGQVAAAAERKKQQHEKNDNEDEGDDDDGDGQRRARKDRVPNKRSGFPYASESRSNLKRAQTMIRQSAKYVELEQRKLDEAMAQLAK